MQLVISSVVIHVITTACLCVNVTVLASLLHSTEMFCYVFFVGTASQFSVTGLRNSIHAIKLIIKTLAIITIKNLPLLFEFFDGEAAGFLLGIITKILPETWTKFRWLSVLGSQNGRKPNLTRIFSWKLKNRSPLIVKNKQLVIKKLQLSIEIYRQIFWMSKKRDSRR